MHRCTRLEQNHIPQLTRIKSLPTKMGDLIMSRTPQELYDYESKRIKKYKEEFSQLIKGHENEESLQNLFDWNGNARAIKSKSYQEIKLIKELESRDPLRVISVRYFKTRRGLGYECKTNKKNIVIHNDGFGGSTYIERNKYANAYNDLTEQNLEDLINYYENK